MICERGKTESITPMCARKPNQFNLLASPMDEIVQNFVRINPEDAGKSFMMAFSGVMQTTVQKMVEAQDNIEPMIKGVVEGVLTVCKDLDDDLFEVINYLSILMIRTVKESHGNIPLTAKAITQATWEATKDLNTDVRRCVLEAATACVIAAYEVDFLTGNEVKDVLIDVIAEIDVISLEPFQECKR